MSARRAALAAVLALAFVLALRQISAHDAGFHLEAGSWILDHRAWPDRDVFTYTLGERPYVDTSWGYQVVVAALARLAGSPGVVLFHALLVVAVFALTGRRAAPWLLLAAVLAAEPRFEARPEVASWLLLAGVLWRLDLDRRRGGGPLWPYALLFVVWGNVHSLVLLGQVAVGCHAAGRFLAERRLAPEAAARVAVALAAPLVNPYGVRASLFGLGLATRMDPENAFQGEIGEFARPLAVLFSDEARFWLLPLAAWIAVLALVPAAAWRLRRSRRFGDLLVLVAFTALSFTMVRNIPLALVAGVPLLGRGAARRGGGLLAAAAASLVALFVATDGYYVQAGRPQRTGLTFNPRVQPVAAAAWAERVDPPGRVLNHLNFGAYLMWARDEPVFIDSRLEVVGEEFFAVYREALSSPAALARTVAVHDVTWIVFPYRLRADLNRGLARHPGWRLVHVDGLAAIYARADRVEAGWIDEGARRALEAAPDLPRADDLPGLGGGPRARWTPFRRARYPDEAFNLGIFHYQREEPVRAAAAFARAIRESGGRFGEMYANLGAALALAGRRDDALRCLELGLSELPLYRRARRAVLRRQIEALGG